jgi:hypothetical protein
MFGLLALFALILYGLAIITSLSAVIASAFRCRAVPLYWLVAVASAALLPLIFAQPRPRRSGTEYGAFSHFIEGAISAPIFVCIVGSVVALILLLVNNAAVRSVSAASWGFLSTSVVRTIQVL